MKITVSILILLMFAMVFTPCGDAYEVSTPQQVEQISKANIVGAIDIHYQTDNQQEECSPICPCQCCPSIDSDTIDLSEITSIAPLALASEANHSFSSVISFLIWSPPQQLV